MLRVLIYILGGYLFFKLIGRVLGPWLLRKATEKMQAQAQAQRQARDGYYDQRREGEVKVEIPNSSRTQKTPSTTPDEGDYIDFEEIKE